MLKLPICQRTGGEVDMKHKHKKIGESLSLPNADIIISPTTIKIVEAW
jgi:hypothetical protein